MANIHYTRLENGEKQQQWPDQHEVYIDSGSWNEDWRHERAIRETLNKSNGATRNFCVSVASILFACGFLLYYGLESWDSRITTSEAVCVLLTTPQYILPALVLGHTLSIHSAHRDRIVLLPNRTAFSDNHLDILRSSGWKIRPVHHIPITDDDPEHPVSKQFVGVMNKLHIWDMTEYEAVAVIDADTLVLGSIDEPFQFLRQSDMYSLAAVHNTLSNPEGNARQLEFDASLNAGVMFARPNSALFHQLIEASKDTSTYANWLPEQNLISKFFSGQWLALHAAYNLNPTYTTDGRTAFFEKIRKKAKILHFYGDIKPWKTCIADDEEEKRLCTPDSLLWIKTMKEVLQELRLDSNTFNDLGWDIPRILAVLEKEEHVVVHYR